MKRRKYLAMSLYGDHPKYCVGACKNVVLARHWYPDYTCVIYHDNTVPLHVLEYLTAAGAMLKHMPQPLFAGGMFWRFLINDEPDMECYLIRDTDSRINEREVRATREWETSGKPFHVVGDHPHHDTAILGGVWGARAGAVPSMRALIDAWPGARDGYDADQEFLRKSVWPIVAAHALQHDTCLREKWPGGVPLPTTLSYANPRFCCEVFDALDRPRRYDWEKMIAYVPTSQKPPLFIRTHLGLGDAIMQNALVRAKAAEHEQVIWPAKPHALPTLRQLWRELPNVQLLEVADDADADTALRATPHASLRLGLFGPGWNEGKPGWDELIYRQADVAFTSRWDKFVLPVPPAPHRVPNGPFAILHEDIGRDYVVRRNKLPSKLPVIPIWPSDSLLDFAPMIAAATELHMIDSCAAILADSIPTVASKLVLHLYARPGAKPPTYRKPWQIIAK